MKGEYFHHFLFHTTTALALHPSVVSSLRPGELLLIPFPFTPTKGVVIIRVTHPQIPLLFLSKKCNSREVEGP